MYHRMSHIFRCPPSKCDVQGGPSAVGAMRDRFSGVRRAGGKAKRSHLKRLRTPWRSAPNGACATGGIHSRRSRMRCLRTPKRGQSSQTSAIGDDIHSQTNIRSIHRSLKIDFPSFFPTNAEAIKGISYHLL